MSKAGNKSFDTEVEFTFEFLSIEWQCKAGYTIESLERGQGSNQFHDVYVVEKIEIFNPDGYDVTDEINKLYEKSEVTRNMVSLTASLLSEAESHAPEL